MSIFNQTIKLTFQNYAIISAYQGKKYFHAAKCVIFRHMDSYDFWPCNPLSLRARVTWLSRHGPGRARHGAFGWFRVSGGGADAPLKLHPSAAASSASPARINVCTGTWRYTHDSNKSPRTPGRFEWNLSARVHLREHLRRALESPVCARAWDSKGMLACSVIVS